MPQLPQLPPSRLARMWLMMGCWASTGGRGQSLLVREEPIILRGLHQMGKRKRFDKEVRIRIPICKRSEYKNALLPDRTRI